MGFCQFRCGAGSGDYIRCPRERRTVSLHWTAKAFGTNSDPIFGPAEFRNFRIGRASRSVCRERVASAAAAAFHGTDSGRWMFLFYSPCHSRMFVKIVLIAAVPRVAFVCGSCRFRFSLSLLLLFLLVSRIAVVLLVVAALAFGDGGCIKFRAHFQSALTSVTPCCKRLLRQILSAPAARTISARAWTNRARFGAASARAKAFGRCDFGITRFAKF